MENNIAVRTKIGPPANSGLTTGTRAPGSSGGVFSTAFAGGFRTHPFIDQLGEFSRDVFENLASRFGDELKDAKLSGGSEPSGRDHESRLSSGYGGFPNHTNSADEKMAKSLLEDPLAWAGNKIDQAVHNAENKVDGWRKDIVSFGEEHGGFVGKAFAKEVAAGIGFVEGADLAVYDMVAGTASLAHGISKVTDPIEWISHPDQNLERVETALKAADTLNKVATPAEWLTNPEGNVKIASSLWNGVTHEYQQAAKEGDWSKFTGRLAVDVGSFFIGTGEVKAAEKGAEAANAAVHVVEGTAKVAVETAEGLNVVEHAAKDAVRIGDTAAETANVTGKTVNELDTAAISANRVEHAAWEMVGPKTTEAGLHNHGSPKLALSQGQIDEIIAIPKGFRPDPSTYLSPDYISEHLSHFEDGASRFMTKANLEKYGIGQRDGTSFVMPKQEADQLLISTKGNPRALEEALGLPENFLDNNQLVQVDIPKPKELGLRIPSGNEAGANEFWIPGGKLPDGNIEAIIDVSGVPAKRYDCTQIQFK